MSGRRDPDYRQPAGVPGPTPIGNGFFPYRNVAGIDLSDCLVLRPRPFRLLIWEPLPTKAPAPPKARPHCCYIRTVIFYHYPYIVSPWVKLWRDGRGRLCRNSGPGGYVEWDQIEYRLTFDDIVEFEGDRFVIGGGRCLWRRGRWWMTHGARREAAAQ